MWTSDKPQTSVKSSRNLQALAEKWDGFFVMKGFENVVSLRTKQVQKMKEIGLSIWKRELAEYL